MNLQGRTILVSGASGGIGASIVEKISDAGGRVIIHYGRDRLKADDLLNKIGGNGWVIGADLSHQDGAATLWKEAIATAGRIHGLVNNAGIRSEVTVDDPLKDWQHSWRNEFQVNLFSAVDLTKFALTHFTEHQDGQLVHMASRTGQMGYVAEAMAYGATKAALINFSKSIARSFGHHGITSVAIAPGWVRTAMVDKIIEEQGEEATAAGIPIGKVATPDEVGELVAFALRPSLRSLNGSTLDLNGGSYIR